MPATDRERKPYLVAYDVADPRRLARIHRYLLGWKIGGQKSFYECWLTAAERRAVTQGLADMIDAGEDRIHIFRLDPRMATHCFGIGETKNDPWFAIL